TSSARARCGTSRARPGSASARSTCRLLPRAARERLHGRVPHGAGGRERRDLAARAARSPPRGLRHLPRAAAPAPAERAGVRRAVSRVSGKAPPTRPAAPPGDAPPPARAAVGPALGRLLRARPRPALLLEP